MTKNLILVFIMAMPLLSYSEDLNLDEISFLLGCWQKNDGAETIEERWVKSSDGKFQGKGKTLKTGKTVFWEDLEITVPDQKIIYQPSPMGKKSVAFLYENRSERNGVKAAAFVNLKHDFPQQIIYSIDSKAPNKLEIELKGMDKNMKPSGFKYFLNKVDCI